MVRIQPNTSKGGKSIIDDDGEVLTCKILEVQYKYNIVRKRCTSVGNEEKSLG